MRCIKAFVLFVLLLCAPSVWAQAVGTAAAGNPGSRFYSQAFTTVGANTFVVPTGVNVIFLTGCGAGGGGGGGHTADPGGGGGGGGSGVCVSRMPVGVTPGSSLTITIGTAGLGGAVGAAGGIVSTNTTIAGLPYGTMTILGASIAAGTGTVTNGGAGGGNANQGGGVTGTGAGANGTYATNRTIGGDVVGGSSGSAGGGATGPGAGGTSVYSNLYNVGNIAGAAASGTKGGGGGGGSSLLGLGVVGGSNAVGTSCSVGYGGGGGGGAPTFAGGNGCQGYLRVEWWN